jgi:hypothetical protein
MRMKPQDPDMAQNFSDIFAAIHAQPKKPPLVSHGVMSRRVSPLSVGMKIDPSTAKRASPVDISPDPTG